MCRLLFCLLAFPAFAFAQEPLSVPAAQKLAQGMHMVQIKNYFRRTTSASRS
jgi:hypothetical protein